MALPLFLEVLLAAFAVMLASLAGAAFAWGKIGPWTERNAAYLVSFSTGIFLVTTYTLLEEAEYLLPSLPLLLYAGGGVALLSLASRLIPDAHHHHGASTDHSHGNIDARRVLLGDAIHNVGDGILLFSAFLIDVRIGIATTAAILLHEAAQEVSEFFILKEAGYSTREALTRNFIVSSTILVGVGIAASFSAAEAFEGPLLAIAAGGFLFVLARDLIPHTTLAVRRGGSIVRHSVAVVLGVSLMTGVVLSSPHAHDDEHEEVPHAERG